MAANKPKPIAPYDGRRSTRANDDGGHERDFDKAYRSLVAHKVDTGQKSLVTQKSLKEYDLGKLGSAKKEPDHGDSYDGTHNGHMKREMMHQYQK